MQCLQYWTYSVFDRCECLSIIYMKYRLDWQYRSIGFLRNVSTKKGRHTRRARSSLMIDTFVPLAAG